MATRSSGPLDLEPDQNMMFDIIALVLVPWFAAFIFGVLSMDIEIWTNMNVTDPMWTVGGADISPALLVVVFGLVWIVATNELDGSDYENFEFAIIVFALASPLLYVFIPAFAELVNYHELMQLFWTLAISVAAVYISYTE